MATPIMFTTVEAIRATLGVDEFDVSNELIMDYGLATVMEARLNTVLPNYDCAFNDDALSGVITLWCQWYGALTFIETARFAIAKKMQANQDSMERYPIDFETLIASLKAKVGMLEAEMNPELAAASDAGHTLVGISKPAYDPVTGNTETRGQLARPRVYGEAFHEDLIR